VPTESEREWLHVRSYVREQRRELASSAAESWAGVVSVAGTGLVTRPEWSLAAPLELGAVALARVSVTPAPDAAALAARSEITRPLRVDGSRYPSYSAAMAELVAPRTFENRPTYRLASADLAGERPRMAFGAGHYFDSVDVGEAAAHEWGARTLGLTDTTPLRDAVADPCDTSRRPVNLAIATLTLRHDEQNGRASFPLHWRDPVKVGHAGGLHMVVPTGVFQAVAGLPGHDANDFSLWHCMLREFSEELLGEPESSGDEPLDYEHWPFAKAMAGGRADGRIRVWVVGLGVDPLTLATDLLTTVTIESRLYDSLFDVSSDANDEGRLVSPTGADGGLWPFTEESVERLTTVEPMQPAGAALLRLAWQHRVDVT